jgi:hypothetical protein
MYDPVKKLFEIILLLLVIVFLISFHEIEKAELFRGVILLIKLSKLIITKLL